MMMDCQVPILTSESCTGTDLLAPEKGTRETRRVEGIRREEKISEESGVKRRGEKKRGVKGRGEKRRAVRGDDRPKDSRQRRNKGIFQAIVWELSTVRIGASKTSF
jgi:hypothetical protein